MEPLRTEISIALMIGLISMAKAITGISDATGEIDFDFKKPEGFERFMVKFPTHQFRFEQPHLLLSFDKSYLMNKLVHADPIASQIAINQCETELSALGERHRIAMRVRDILTNSEQHYLSIEAVADRLHMSDRTLKRQLAAEGTSFSTLVDEVRYRHATSCFHEQTSLWNRLPMNSAIVMSPTSVVPLNAGVVAVQATGVKIRIYKPFVLQQRMYKSCQK